MNRNFDHQPDGYRETIERGVAGIRTFRGGLTEGTLSREEAIRKLKEVLSKTETVVIGAGAGLSTAAGFTYSGARFEKYFSDFEKAFGFRDMYSGGFYPFPSEEIRWAFWARNIYVNRYMNPPRSVYQNLYSLVKGKDYFVITTNVDHCFQKAGFEKKRLFYTQGDYGLFQSVRASIQKTYDNEAWVMRAMEAQGFVKNDEGIFEMPAEGKVSMEIPSSLIPKSPDDGSDVKMNLRADDTFVEDEGWHAASAAYADFLKQHEGWPVLFLEIGVGGNTPVIIKYPFWQMTRDQPEAIYACLNYDEAVCPEEIESRSIVIGGDSAEVIERLMENTETGHPV